jgi:cytochrome oxidase assembly protein ShyY1
MLIAEQAPEGLKPVAPPSVEDVPNNHLAYAVQWFFFAAVAAFIYVLALRRRTRTHESS